MRNDAQTTGEGRSPFGRLLREFRVAANLSQESLAERAGVSSDGISVLERAARRTLIRSRCSRRHSSFPRRIAPVCKRLQRVRPCRAVEVYSRRTAAAWDVTICPSR
jgi:DNA-binding XRE family transcriptional regulator